MKKINNSLFINNSIKLLKLYKRKYVIICMDLLLWSDIFLDEKQECDDHDMTTAQSESEEEEEEGESTKRRPKKKRYTDYITGFYTL